VAISITRMAGVTEALGRNALVGTSPIWGNGWDGGLSVKHGNLDRLALREAHAYANEF